MTEENFLPFSSKWTVDWQQARLVAGWHTRSISWYLNFRYVFTKRDLQSCLKCPAEPVFIAKREVGTKRCASFHTIVPREPEIFTVTRASSVSARSTVSTGPTRKNFVAYARPGHTGPGKNRPNASPARPGAPVPLGRAETGLSPFPVRSGTIVQPGMRREYRYHASREHTRILKEQSKKTASPAPKTPTQTYMVKGKV